MKTAWLTIAVATAVTGSVMATDLNVQISSNGHALVHVAPGASVPYSVSGSLSNNASGGLAMFALDLSFTGGSLSPAPAPTTFPMRNFAVPLGFNNPAGYGGTLHAGSLLQVGGAQNTINNTVAPFPNGTVITDVAQPGSPVDLVTGFASAPYVVGSFSLSASNLQANVLQPGQTGTPFWKCDATGAGSSSPLTIVVQAVRATAVNVSVGHSVDFTISAGPANAGRTYMMLGSTHGTNPGYPLPGGLTLPLTPDRYLQFTEQTPNSTILSHSQGVLDANGRATVTFHPNARFEGLTVNHAFFLLGPIDFVSEAEAVHVVH